MSFDNVIYLEPLEHDDVVVEFKSQEALRAMAGAVQSTTHSDRIIDQCQEIDRIYGLSQMSDDTANRLSAVLCVLLDIAEELR